MELIKNGCAATILETGAVMKTAFCGPCFRRRHACQQRLQYPPFHKNFPNREGSKLQNGQIASVALMDARSIAATAANKGVLTPATEFDGTFVNINTTLIPKSMRIVYLIQGRGRSGCGNPFRAQYQGLAGDVQPS
ncbi:MAG: hypothetical protein ACLUOI_24620 [Eisenbergiella sp.]